MIDHFPSKGNAGVTDPLSGRFSSAIPDVELRVLDTIADDRGSFCETFRQSWFAGAPAFVQGNASVSRPNVLRGMHYHLRQDDLWLVLRGHVTVALADIRPAQKRRVERFDVTAGGGVYIPRGVAHGFYAHDDVLLIYYVTNYYDGTDELGIAWDDPDLAIPWPHRAPILSPRDHNNPRLRDIDRDKLPGESRMSAREQG
ncbi:MAG: dTDP-4-dehydrorhamnose 3,5-epimerase family protein [Proteobacteria bacterium]|nr:dTDP-4-dehydrorhamnose 3,5-epimerase family protein [Pseudomonadota bacterium]